MLSYRLAMFNETLNKANDMWDRLDITSLK